jgi:chromosome segregation ATPase
MPDQAIEQAENQIEAAQEDVAAAQQDVRGSRDAEASARLERAEQRLDEVERGLAELLQRVETAAGKDHVHPMPSQLSALEEHLVSMEREEQGVQRLPWYKRPLFGGK